MPDLTKRESSTRWISLGLVAASVLCCAGADLVHAVTRRVDVDATGAVHDGGTWCRAYLNLQDALAVALPGDTIRVANGTYTPDRGGGQTPGDRAATFLLLVGVTVEGGYAGCGAPNPDARDVAAFETILSGDLNGDDGPNFANNDENSLHVVTGAADPSAVLDGFTVRGGNANVGFGGVDSYGGGILNVGQRSTVVRCKFVDNFATAGAPGVDSYAGSNVALSRTTVANSTIVSSASTLTLDQSVIEGDLLVGTASVIEGSGVLGSGVYLCADSVETSRGFVRANDPGKRLTITGVATSIAGGTFEALNGGELLIDTDVTPESNFCYDVPCPARLLAEGGKILAGRDVVIMADTVTIAPAGEYRSDPAFADANAAALYAETMSVHESQPGGPPGQMALGGGMGGGSAGNFVLEGPNAGSDSSCTPPILNVATDATLQVGGDFQIMGSAFIDYSSSQFLELTGSFDNKSIRPEGFEWREGGLAMLAPVGAPADPGRGFQQLIEAAGRNDGPDALIEAQYEFGTLEVRAGADVTVVDQFDNDQMGQGPCTEALYVDNLSVEAGAILRLENTHLYYKNLVNTEGAFFATGCGAFLFNSFCSANGQCDDGDRCTLDVCDAQGLCSNDPGGPAIVYEEPFLARSYCTDDAFTSCTRDGECVAGTCEKLACLWTLPNAYDLTIGEFANSSDIGSYPFFSYNQFDSLGFTHAGNPIPDRGYWYLVRPTCPAPASWQTVPGAEPVRDLALP